jgi:hypothetical protein
MLTARYAETGDVLASGAYSVKIFEYDNIQGRFLNKLKESLADRNGVDASESCRELREWFAEMNAHLQDERTALLPPEAEQILNATERVEVRGGETTTWHVTLTVDGQAKELEFTAAEMTSGSPASLEEQYANQFYEILELGEDEWRTIRDEWQARKEVVAVVDETAKDSIAERVLEFLATAIMPVANRDKMGNDTVAAWVDRTNEAAHAEAGDDPVLWVQDSALVDAIDRAGKSATYKGSLIKNLISRGELHGSGTRRRWAWNRRVRVYPFVPDALGVDADEFDEPAAPANQSEVDA